MVSRQVAWHWVQLSMHAFMAWERWAAVWWVMSYSFGIAIADESRRARITVPMQLLAHCRANASVVPPLVTSSTVYGSVWPPGISLPGEPSSAARRFGKACVHRCRARWVRDH